MDRGIMIDQIILHEMNKSIEKFEQDLKIPIGFFNNLLQEDDWSFVIKISALLETASSDVLVSALGYSEIEEVISYLDYGNYKSGKIVFLEKLDVINKNQAITLREFLVIRNKIAHTLENINFTFEEYISKLNKNQKQKFISSFGYGVSESINIKGHSINKKDFVLENPKISILITIREIIACMYLSKEKKEIQHKMTLELTPEIIKKLLLHKVGEQ